MNFDSDMPALCRTTDPDIYFPDPMKSRQLAGPAGQEIVAQTIVALDLCKACTIQQACLQFAVNNREFYGIFGGSMPFEREAVIPELKGQPTALPFYTKLRKAVLEIREDLVCPPIPQPNRPYTPYVEYLPPYSPSSSSQQE